MRLGLIGSTGHWQTYAPAIEHVAGLTLVAVAPAGPEETTGVFDHALAMDLPTLEGLFQLARNKKLALVPMDTMRGDPVLAAMRRAVRGGEIGEPLLSFSQKTYKFP